MTRRAEYWVTTICLAVLVLHGIGSVNGSAKSSRSHDDLEGSESAYSTQITGGCPYAHRHNVPLGRANRGLVTNLLDAARPKNHRYGSKVGLVRNVTSLLHQKIECGDKYPESCRNSRYRSSDGSCNNLDHPTWGMANTRYARLQPANYGDGIRSPTKSISGADLPLSRLVSYTLHPNLDIDDKRWTLSAMQYGQIITHDMAMLDGPTQSRPHLTRCCTDDGQLIEKLLLFGQCYPIVIPYDDPIYGSTNIRCLNFIRSLTDLDRGCRPRFHPAEQLNTVSHYLDLSIIYGSSNEVTAYLRAGTGGLMRMDYRNNKQWPPAASNRSLLCEDSASYDSCYDIGDSRANQNPQLTILHLILLREHNRVAYALAKLNPHWTDETVFQETRRIVIAEHQHITYYEWLPIFMGRNVVHSNGIVYNTTDYVNDYDPQVDASVLNEHSTAGFRYFHSLVAGQLQFVSENRGINGALRLSDYFNKPGIIEKGNNLDDLVRGMTFQAQKASDENLDPEITQYLFKGMRQLGSDLRARDIQRNRDHGLASYNDLREYCGLPRAKYMSDFEDFLEEEVGSKIAQLYASPDDVELTIGTALEEDIPGTFSGPTLSCILIKQFQRTRVGDRFWYERGDHQAAFTIEQLNEIRKVSIARLFCDNSDSITQMQRSAFEKVSARNPLVSCKNIPQMDLTYWKDFAPEVVREQYLYKK